MARIRQCKALKGSYNEISKIYKKTTEQEIDRLVSKHFDKHYVNFEEFKKDIFDKIEQAFKDIEQGRYTTMEDAVAELEARYGLSKG